MTIKQGLTRTEFFPLEGGLDLANSPLVMSPGSMVDGRNYEIAPRGYRRIGGYERFDGQTKPSEAGYVIINYTNGANIFTGEIVVDSVTGATGIALQDAYTEGSSSGSEEPAGALTDGVETLTDGPETLTDGTTVVTGGGDGTVVLLITSSVNFAVGSDLLVSSISRGTTETVSLTASSATLDSTYKALAEAAARTNITAVPGAGSVLGVWLYKDTVYAFRNNSTNTRCYMHKSSSSGWQTVITPPLEPNGKYRFINYNFGGHSGKLKMYGCDGVNRAFEFSIDEGYVPINTGMENDSPNVIAAHHNYLFLGFKGGSIQHSSVGEPLEWSAITGAAELSVGDEITDFLPVPGGSMIIWTKNTLSVLYGSSSNITSPNLWQLKKLSADAGGVAKTAAITMAPIFLSDTGISVVSTSDTFGDFQANTLSQKVQSLIDSYRDLVIGSFVLRAKNQYQLVFSNGEALVMTFAGDKIKGFTANDYGIPIRCVSGTSRSDEENDVLEDEVYFGSDNGYVYQINSGFTFDGVAISAYFILPHFHAKSLRYKKRWRKAIIEAETDSGGAVLFGFKPDFQMYSAIPESSSSSISRSISGGIWDRSNWDEFYWSTDLSIQSRYLEIRINGVSPGISGQIFSKDTNDESHTVISMIYQYDMRGLIK